MGKEGLDLGMLLNYCPGTSNPSKVAPSWYENQTWSGGPSPSAHAAGPSAENFLLLAFSRVMHDLEDFVQAVRTEERLRNPTTFAEGPDDRTDEAETVAKDPEYRVPVGRLRKAKKILDGCEFDAPQELYPEEKNAILIRSLAIACPSWIAVVDETPRAPGTKPRWYAGRVPCQRRKPTTI